jgi:hypothetical protein
VVAGVALAMLGVKALKILPNIPFAPGHKLVVLTPLYVAAALLTQSAMGATLTGAVMGTVAFFLGDGKYGVFEVLKHISPGLVADAAIGLRGARGGRVYWSVVGGLMGASRFLTIFLVTLFIQPPAVAFAMLVPGFTVHTGFGIVAGFVCFHVAREIDRRRSEVVPS